MSENPDIVFFLHVICARSIYDDWSWVISNSNWTEWSSRASNFKLMGGARSARPLCDYEHHRFVNCTIRGPITNQ